jgi:hypothetical protein
VVKRKMRNLINKIPKPQTVFFIFCFFLGFATSFAQEEKPEPIKNKKAGENKSEKKIDNKNDKKR